MAKERVMKWPNTLTVVRHGESGYNILKALKEQDPRYVEFKRAYNKRKNDIERERAQQLAKELMEDGQYVMKVGDHDTPLTDKGKRQAEVTGEKLKDRIKLPDVILVSPYLRTHQTLGHMAVGWPELKDVKTVEEERLREKEHGLALLYNDWRIFHIMHPEQDQLQGLQGQYWYRFPQGESVPDVRERVRSEMITVSRDYKEKEVLMVGHHLLILALRANMERMDEHGFRDLDENNKPRNCSLTIYEGRPDLGEEGKLVLSAYNEVLYGPDLD